MELASQEEPHVAVESMNQLVDRLAEMGLSREHAELVAGDPRHAETLQQLLRVDAQKTMSHAMFDLVECRASVPPFTPEPQSRDKLIATILQQRQHDDQQEHVEAHSIFGFPKPFSSAPLASLTKIYLEDVRVNGNHEGRYLLGRSIVTPRLCAGLHGALEDEKGQVAFFSIDHWPLQPALARHMDRMEAVLPEGCCFVIKEPQYKLREVGTAEDADEQPVLHVESPSDVVFLPVGHPLLIGAWQPTSDSHHRIHAVKNEDRHPLALVNQVSDDISMNPPDPLLAMLKLHRAYIYLQTGQYRAAWTDASNALDLFATVVRKDGHAGRGGMLNALQARAKAEWGLRLLSKAKETLLEVIRIASDGSETLEETQSVLERLDKLETEASTGQYDYVKLFEERSKLRVQEVGEFVGPVETREVDQREGGRGMFATRDISPGELLLCERAFAVAYPTDGKVQHTAYNIAHDEIDLNGHQRLLVGNVMAKIMDDPSMGAVLDTLYAGSDAFPPTRLTRTTSDLELDLEPILDTSKIEEVCFYNAVELIPPDPSRIGYAHGLFVKASMFNHSCAPNAARSFFGDTVFIRAQAPIKAGEEILVSYVRESYPLAQRDKHLEGLLPGRCDCELCCLDRADGSLLLDKRTAIIHNKKFRPEDEKSSRLIGLLNAQVQQLSATYKPSRSSLRPELAVVHRHLVRELSKTAANVKPMIASAVASIESAGVQAAFLVDARAKGPIKPSKRSKVPLYRKAPGDGQGEIGVALVVASTLHRLEKNDEANSWLKFALALNDLVMGGGKELFVVRWRDELKELDLEDFAAIVFASC